MLLKYFVIFFTSVNEQFSRFVRIYYSVPRTLRYINYDDSAFGSCTDFLEDVISIIGNVASSVGLKDYALDGWLQKSFDKLARNAGKYS